MRRFHAVYLAGPDPWGPEAEEVLARKRQLLEAAGLEALDSRIGPDVAADASEAAARRIYAERLSTLRRADAVIANLSPWRGPHCDPGAAFETGFAAALGKPVFAYLNVEEEEQAELLRRVERRYGARRRRDGGWRDADGAAVESFGLPESVMLWAEARRFFVIVTPDPGADLTGVELCLDALKLYAG